MRYKATIIILALAIAVSPAVMIFAQASNGDSSTLMSADVEIKNFAFRPGEVTIASGGAVMWTNQDNAPHTIKLNGEESKIFEKGDTFSRTFDKSGTYDYICGIHPYMKGKVIVK